MPTPCKKIYTLHAGCKKRVDTSLRFFGINGSGYGAVEVDFNKFKSDNLPKGLRLKFLRLYFKI